MLKKPSKTNICTPHKKKLIKTRLNRNKNIKVSASVTHMANHSIWISHSEDISYVTEELRHLIIGPEIHSDILYNPCAFLQSLSRCIPENIPLSARPLNFLPNSIKKLLQYDQALDLFSLHCHISNFDFVCSLKHRLSDILLFESVASSRPVTHCGSDVVYQELVAVRKGW